jgi:hypothetical protein
MVFNVTLSDEDDDGEASRRSVGTAAPRPSPRLGILPYATAWLAPLDEPDPVAWLRNLELLLASCQSQDEVGEAGAHTSVRNAVAKAPPDVRRRVSELLATHFKRLAPGEAKPHDAGAHDQPAKSADDFAAAQTLAGDEKPAA